MTMIKSPFLIVENFISPLACEQIVDGLGFYIPDTNIEGTSIKMSKHHERLEKVVYENFKPLIPKIEKYYDIKHRGTELMNFEFRAEGCKPEVLCDNSSYVNKQWARTRDRDLSVVLFLVDYQDRIPFDSDYEVYGGKLEFPQHNFGFNPERGTMIIFPSGPHFINAYSEIIAGDLFTANFYISADIPLFHDPKKFPGNYKTWFANS